MSSLVIALDGPDGVGKSTQVSLLADALKQKGLHVHLTRNSGGTPIGEALREVSLSETPRPAETDVYISLAMSAALAEDLRGRPSDEITVIDRSPLSMVAYNGYASELKDVDWILEACQKIVNAYGMDILFYLDAPQEILDARREQRALANDYFESKGADFHHRVQEGYEHALEYLSQQSGSALQIVRLDATQSIEALHQTILETVLGKASHL